MSVEVIDPDPPRKRKPKQEVAHVVESAPPSAPPTPMDMLSRALANGTTPEVLEKLLALQERWEGERQRQAFEEAIAAAKSEIPVIVKNRTVSHGQGKAQYRHEDLGEIARTIDPVLGRHGLSYRFRTQTNEGRVQVTCIVAHKQGHCEENSLQAGLDTSGAKNNIQALGSSITYLQRYTLKAALGHRK